MKKTTSYSLWFVPEVGSEQDIYLRKVINKLSHLYSTPIFNPHVTLIGNILKNEEEVKVKVLNLMKKLNSCEITLRGIDSHEAYFQALFLKADKSSQILNAYKMAQEIFGLSGMEYFPHLSLAYGDFSTKQVSILKGALEKENNVRSLSFFAQSLELWYIEDIVERWRKVSTFYLMK